VQRLISIENERGTAEEYFLEDFFMPFVHNTLAKECPGELKALLACIILLHSQVLQSRQLFLPDTFYRLLVGTKYYKYPVHA